MMRRIWVVFVCLIAVLLAADAFGAFNRFFPDPKPDRASLYRDMFTGLFGTLVGFHLALTADHWEKRKDDDTRRINLYGALKAVLCANKRYLEIMRLYFESPDDSRPSFLCDVVSLNALVPLRCELLADDETRRSIDHAHFELSHVNRRVEITFNLRDDDAIRTGTIELITTTEKACQKAIDEITSRLSPTS